MQDLSLICICKQETFSPVKVSLINSSQTDKDLPVPVKTPNQKTLSTVLVYYTKNNYANIYFTIRYMEEAYFKVKE